MTLMIKKDNAARKKILRLSRKRVWQAIFNTLSSNADTKWPMIDSAMIRVHQYAYGAKGEKSADRQIKREPLP